VQGDHHRLDERGGRRTPSIPAWRARSPTLLAFGGGSAIELASAVAVFWIFRTKGSSEHAEQHAAQIARVLLFALAVAVFAHAETEPEPKGYIRESAISKNYAAHWYRWCKPRVAGMR